MWWYVIQNPKTTRHWKCGNSTVAYSKLKCTAQLFPFKFFFSFSPPVHSVGILTEIYVVVKIKQKVFWALLQCIHVNFFIFFESVNLTHSVESTESKVLEITNLVLKTYIIAIMQFWSLLIIIISLNFAYFYATNMSTNLAQPNLTLIAITRWEILESLVKLTTLFQKYQRFDLRPYLFCTKRAWLG